MEGAYAIANELYLKHISGSGRYSADLEDATLRVIKDDQARPETPLSIDPELDSWFR
jgi:hypothetical protein